MAHNAFSIEAQVVSVSGGHVHSGELAANIALLLVVFALTGALQLEHARSCYVLGLQKVVARLFLIAPAYSLFEILTAYGRSSAGFWEVAMGLVDAYSLYCFFALLILGCGGEKVLCSHMPEDGPGVTLKMFLIWPVRFSSHARMYHFFKAVVLQLMITRPALLALSVLCSLSPTTAGEVGVRIFRILAVLSLVFTVIIIGKAYLAFRAWLFKAFKPVHVFLVIKGYLLLVVAQNFLLSVAVSGKNGAPMEPDRAVRLWHGNALLVAIESLLYLVLMRWLLHPRIFRRYNPRLPGIPISFLDFLTEVWRLIRALDTEIPPQGQLSDDETEINSYEDRDAGGIEAPGRAKSTQS